MSASSDFERVLREASLRVTGPRVAVLRAVHGHPHADTDSICGVVREDLGVVVSLQAVYDVLRALTDAGLVRRIQPAGSVATATVAMPPLAGGRPLGVIASAPMMSIASSETTLWYSLQYSLKIPPSGPG